MAASGKKGKKTKGKTIALNEFLSEGSGPPAPMVVPRKSQAWADETDDEFDLMVPRKENKVILPTAPRATRSPTIDEDMVPKMPPYSAYISNLPYDVDQDEIAHFFKDLNFVNIRLPKDDKNGKLKGFGYVEFETRSNLINALKMGDSIIKSRRIRIEVADNNENDRRRGGRDFRDMGRDRMDGPDRTLGDWRTGPRYEPPANESESYRDGGGFGSRSSRSAPREYGGPGGGFMERSACGPPDYNDRERDRGFRSSGGFGDRDRERDRDRYSGRDGGRDYGRSGGGFGPRRNYDDMPKRDDPPAESKTRPRLNLQRRTLPVEEAAATAPPISNDSGSGGASSSIFGGAKPVDTAARERQIEERLAKEKNDAPPAAPSFRDTKDNRESRSEEQTWSRKNMRNGQTSPDNNNEEGSRGNSPTGSDNKNDNPRRQISEERDDKASAKAPPPRSGNEKSSGPPPTNKARESDRDNKRVNNAQDDLARMPKYKEQETPNFAGSNKYSYLLNDEEQVSTTSDD